MKMVWSLHCALQKDLLGEFIHMDIMTAVSFVEMEEQQMYWGSVVPKATLNVAHKG